MGLDSSHRPDKPQLKGDVISASTTRISGRKGYAEGLIQVELIGHPFRYRVGIDRLGGAPRLVELHLLPLDGADAEIDSDTIRAVPVRRLALAAAQFIGIDEAPFAVPGEADDPTMRLRPDHNPGRKMNKAHYRQVRNLLIAAREMGLSPRRHVATTLHASIPTVDRWIRDAKKMGILDPNWNNKGHNVT